MRLTRKGRKADQEAADAASSDAALEGDGAAEDDVLDLSGGPLDSEDVDLPEGSYVDLGSLWIRPPQGAELRLQVEETTGAVMAVVLVAEDAALELRAFAAPRAGDLWAEARGDIATETERQGGTAAEVEGPFGAELRCIMPVTTPEGEEAVQPSRVIGVNGPRWLLRATLLGRPAAEPDDAGPWEDAVRAVVVHRGTEAMPVGEALPLQLPTDAQRLD